MPLDLQPVLDLEPIEDEPLRSSVNPERRAELVAQLKDERTRGRVDDAVLGALDYLSREVVEPLTPHGLLSQPTRIAGLATGTSIPDPNTVITPPRIEGPEAWKGAANAGLSLVAGLASPETVLTLPAAGAGAAGRLLFASTMAPHLPEQIERAGTVLGSTGTAAEKIEAVAEPLLTGGMLAALSHTPRPRTLGVKPTEVVPEGTSGSPISQPLEQSNLGAGTATTPVVEPLKVTAPAEKTTPVISVEAPRAEAAVTPAPELVGMGGALAGEVAPQGTGLKNAIGELERIGHGLEEAAPTEKRAMGAAWERSAQQLGDNPRAGEELAASLKDNPERGITDNDSALLLRHKVDLLNAKNAAAERTFTAETPEAKAEAEAAFNNYSKQLEDLLDAVKARGSQWGREGRWRQALAFEDYSLETMSRDRAQALDRPLTDVERTEIKTLHDRIAELERKIAEGERVGVEVESTAAATEAFARTVKQERAKPDAADRGAVLEGLQEAVQDSGAIPDDLARYVKELFKYHVERGAQTLADATKAVKGDLEPIIGPVTDRQIADWFSDYGKSTPATKDAVKIKLSQLRGEAQKTSALADVVEKNQAPLATGPRRVPPSDATRRITKKIHEEMKKRGIQVTDPARQLATSLQTIKTRLDNAIADVRFEIATRNRIVREKGATPSDAEVVSKRAELAELRRQRDEIFGPREMTDAQRLALAERAAERNEAMWNDRLARARKGDFGTDKPSKPKLHSAKLDAIKARAEAAAAEVDHLKATNQAFQEAQRIKEQTSQLEGIDKRIEEVVRQINEGDIAVRASGSKAVIPELAAKRAELAELNKIKQQLRNAAKPKRTPEEIALKAAHSRTLNEIAFYQDRVARGDFLTPRRTPTKVVPDNRLNELRAENEKWKQQYREGNYKARMAQRTWWEKTKAGIRQAWRLPKNLVASFDLSAPRQAIGALLAAVPSPSRWGQTAAAFRDMIESVFRSEAFANRLTQERLNRPNAKNGIDKQAKVEYTKLDETSFTAAEENARSILDDWAKLNFRTGNLAKTVATAPVKVISKGVHISNRAFSVFLNKIRADLLDTLVANEFADQAPTKAQLEKIGNLVNVMTGRGALNPKTQSVAGVVLWSPKLLASRIQTLLGQPFFKAGLDAKMQKMVAKEYLRMAVGGAALWNVSQLFGDVEDDPRSSDYRKVRIGNTRVDPWGGFQQVTVVGNRLIRGSTKTLKGEVRPLRGNIPFGGTTSKDVAWNFFRSKLNPEAGIVYDVILGDMKNPVGEPITPESAVTAMTIPLSFQDIFDIAEEQGIPKTVVLTALNLFGFGVSQYETRKP